MTRRDLRNRARQYDRDARPLPWVVAALIWGALLLFGALKLAGVL